MISSSKSGKRQKQKQKGLGSLPSVPSEPGVSFADRHWQAERAAPACAVAKEGGEAPASCRQGLFCTPCFREQQRRPSCSSCPWCWLLQDTLGARTCATGGGHNHQLQEAGSEVGRVAGVSLSICTGHPAPLHQLGKNTHMNYFILRHLNETFPDFSPKESA